MRVHAHPPIHPVRLLSPAPRHRSARSNDQLLPLTQLKRLSSLAIAAHISEDAPGEGEGPCLEGLPEAVLRLRGLTSLRLSSKGGVGGWVGGGLVGGRGGAEAQGADQPQALIQRWGGWVGGWGVGGGQRRC